MTERREEGCAAQIDTGDACGSLALAKRCHSASVRKPEDPQPRAHAHKTVRHE